MRARPEYVVVGRFGRPRGVSGEIFIIPLTDNPERFKEEGTFWLESENGWTEIKIASIRVISGRVAARIAGVENPEQARQFTNQFLYIRGADLDEPPEGSYFHFDLIGCRMIDLSGRDVGEIVGVENYPANDVWIVKSRKGTQHMFPAVRSFVKEVDIDKKLIVVNPPEGILDSPDED